jgi:hypothetical protein
MNKELSFCGDDQNARAMLTINGDTKGRPKGKAPL